MDVDILTANKEDLALILQLQKQCYVSEAEIYDDYHIPPLEQNLVSLETEFDKSDILVAKVKGEIVGSVRASNDNETCYIGKLIVRTDLQNRGLGKCLMNAIELLNNNCYRYELFTGHKSFKNVHLYNKLGYKEFKQQKINDKLTLYS